MYYHAEWVPLLKKSALPQEILKINFSEYIYNHLIFGTMASSSTDRATWLVIMCAPNQLQVHSWSINTVFHHCVCVFIITARNKDLQCSTCILMHFSCFTLDRINFPKLYFDSIGWVKSWTSVKISFMAILCAASWDTDKMLASENCLRTYSSVYRANTSTSINSLFIQAQENERTNLVE